MSSETIPLTPQEVLALQQRVQQLETENVELQQQLAELKTTSNDFQEIINSIPGVVFQFRESQGRWFVDYVSEQIYQIAGITAEAIRADINNFIALQHPEDLPRYYAESQRSITQMTSHCYEGRLIRPDGQVRWWHVSSTPKRLPNGDLLFFGMIQDVSDRKNTELALAKAYQELEQVNGHLEQKVAQRASQLEQTIVRLQQENQERREAEEGLRRSEIKFHKMTTNVPGVIYQIKIEPSGMFNFTYLSPYCTELLEVEPYQGLSHAGLILGQIHPDDRDNFFESIALSAETLRPWELMFRIINPSGKLRWVQGQSRPERLADGSTLWDGVMLDVTDRKIAEEQLHFQQLQLRAILDNLPCRVWLNDLDGSYITVNKMFGAFLNLTPEQIVGRSIQSIFPPEEAAKYILEDRQIIRQARQISFEEQLQYNGETRWFFTTKIPLRDNHNQIIGIIGVSLDISDLKKTEVAMREQQERFRSIFELSPLGIVLSDTNANIVEVNDVFCRILGYTKEELIRKKPWDITHADDVVSNQKLMARMHNGQIDTYAMEKRYIRKDGSVLWVNLSVAAIKDHQGKFKYTLSVIDDISDRKAAEAQLRQQTEQLTCALEEVKRTQSQLVQAEKMSSLGQLVAGVAHEINNPVNFIYGNLSHAGEYTNQILQLLELYQKHYPEPAQEIVQQSEEIEVDFLVDDLPKLLNSMKVGAERIQKIVLSLRTFSRMDEAEQKAVDIHEGIDSTLMILQHRFKAKHDRPGIEIIRDYGELPLVDCYPGQLNQVFMNILVNSLDALEERDQNRPLDEAKAKPSQISIFTKVLDNSWVEIRISDNGPGIPEEYMPKLFDPFFTTKPVGKGTGMGLSISYQIITERHHGRINCTSSLEQGTEFIIQIPSRLQ